MSVDGGAIILTMSFWSIVFLYAVYRLTRKK
jgi:hypothetical protein